MEQRTQLIPHAKELAEHANEIRQLSKRVADDIVSIGRHLFEAKTLAGHGHWLAWLDREFGWAESTARNYINVFQMVALRGKSANFADLVSVPISGLYLLSAPSTPPEARTEIMERAKAGERIKVATVKEAMERVLYCPSARGKSFDLSILLRARRVFV
jgi:hypothetical protein